MSIKDRGVKWQRYHADISNNHDVLAITGGEEWPHNYIERLNQDLNITCGNKRDARKL